MSIINRERNAKDSMGCILTVNKRTHAKIDKNGNKNGFTRLAKEFSLEPDE